MARWTNPASVVEGARSSQVEHELVVVSSPDNPDLEAPSQDPVDAGTCIGTTD